MNYKRISKQNLLMLQPTECQYVLLNTLWRFLSTTSFELICSLFKCLYRKILQKKKLASSLCPVTGKAY